MLELFRLTLVLIRFLNKINFSLGGLGVLRGGELSHSRLQRLRRGHVLLTERDNVQAFTTTINTITTTATTTTKLRAIR